MTKAEHKQVDKRNAMMKAIIAGEEKAARHGNKDYDRYVSIIVAIEEKFNYQTKPAKPVKSFGGALAAGLTVTVKRADGQVDVLNAK